MLKAITLLGSSSGRNAGDAALIAAIMDGVDARCGERLLYEIPTIRPAYIRDHYPHRVRPVGMLPWNFSVKMLGLPTLRSVLRTDLTLIFDAILFDRALYNPLFNFMSTLRLILPYARRKGRRLACYNVGVGPVRTAAGRRMLRTLADLMDFITVRDQESLDILRDVGARNPRIVMGADAAVNAPAADDARVTAILRKAGFEPGEPALGINVNIYVDTWAGAGGRALGRRRFLDIYAAALRKVIAELNVPLLFFSTQHADVGITRELIARLPPGHKTGWIDNRQYDHAEMKGALSRASLLCGMRLHSMILASSGMAPIIGLTYQPKVSYYFNTLGLQNYTLGFDRFDEESLARHILQGWQDRAAIRRQLQDAIPRLQREAGKAAELVAALHRGEDLDAAFKDSLTPS